MTDNKTTKTSEEKKKRHVFIFPRGIPGMENITRFYIEPMSGTPVFFMLQAVEDATIGIILVDPFPFFPAYGFDLSEADQQELVVENAADLLVLTTVTVYEKKFFTNLVAPFILNTKNSMGKQVILPGMDDKDLRVLLNIPSVVAAG